MRTPKILLQLAESINGTCEIITYRHAGHGGLSKGFAIVDKDKNELLECEPVNYSNGDRWMIKNKCLSTIGYLKSFRLRKGYRFDIKPMHTGYIFNSKKHIK